MSRPTVIVIGLGAVGSAAALQLARAGATVIGFDRWRPPHRLGSTHGESRITRATAWEGARYVPLVARAQQLWADFARQTQRQYFSATGGLFVGLPDEYHVQGSHESAIAAQLPHGLLSRRDITERWPWLRVPDGMVGFWDPGAGVLAPERIVDDQLQMAAQLGATLHLDTTVQGIETSSAGVRVNSSRGEHRADAIVVCAGGWMSQLLGWTGPELQVERVTQHWFAEAALRHDAPVLLLSDGHGHATAVFPAEGARIKVAGHGSGRVGPVDALDRTVHADDIAGAESLLRGYLPQHAGAYRESSSCFYTKTPSGHFVIDRMPGAANVVFASACNGYGFKFSAAVGEAVAAMALGDEPPVDVSSWRIA